MDKYYRNMHYRNRGYGNAKVQINTFIRAIDS